MNNTCIHRAYCNLTTWQEFYSTEYFYNAKVHEAELGEMFVLQKFPVVR